MTVGAWEDPDPIVRLRRIRQIVGDLDAARSLMLREQAKAVREARAVGVSYATLGQVMGLSRSRAHQIDSRVQAALRASAD